MADLQQTATELAGKLHVLREQYAQSLYEAEVHPTQDTKFALKNIENRINSVSAGIYRLQNTTSKRLEHLEDTIKDTRAKTAIWSGELKVLDKTSNSIYPTRDALLASQMEAEVESATFAFFYNIAGIALVIAMGLKLKAPSSA